MASAKLRAISRVRWTVLTMAVVLLCHLLLQDWTMQAFIRPTKDFPESLYQVRSVHFCAGQLLYLLHSRSTEPAIMSTTTPTLSQPAQRQLWHHVSVHAPCRSSSSSSSTLMLKHRCRWQCRSSQRPQWLFCHLYRLFLQRQTIAAPIAIAYADIHYKLQTALPVCRCQWAWAQAAAR